MTEKIQSRRRRKDSFSVINITYLRYVFTRMIELAASEITKQIPSFVHSIKMLMTMLANI